MHERLCLICDLSALSNRAVMGSSPPCPNHGWVRGQPSLVLQGHHAWAGNASCLVTLGFPCAYKHIELSFLRWR